MKIRITCLALALAVAGCGSNSNNNGGTPDSGSGGGGGSGNSGPYVGTWTADVSGWSVTMVIKEANVVNGTTYPTGTIGTNKPDCFSSGTVEGNISPSSQVTLLGSISGDADSELDIVGKVSGNTITGTFAAKGKIASCNLSETAVTFTRK